MADFFGHDPERFQKDFSGIKDIGEMFGQFLRNVPAVIERDENFRVKRAQFGEDKEVNDQLFKELQQAADAWGLDPGFITPPSTRQDPKEYAASEVSSLLTAATNAGVDQKLMVDTITKFQGGGALPEVQELGQRQRAIETRTGQFGEQPQEPILGGTPQAPQQKQGFIEEDIPARGLPPEEQEMQSLQDIPLFGGGVPQQQQDPVDATLQQIGQIPPSVEEGGQPESLEGKTPDEIRAGQRSRNLEDLQTGLIDVGEFDKRAAEFDKAETGRVKAKADRITADEKLKAVEDEQKWKRIFTAVGRRQKLSLTDDPTDTPVTTIDQNRDPGDYKIHTDVPAPFIKKTQSFKAEFKKGSPGDKAQKAEQKSKLDKNIIDLVGKMNTAQKAINDLAVKSKLGDNALLLQGTNKKDIDKLLEDNKASLRSLRVTLNELKQRKKELSETEFTREEMITDMTRAGKDKEFQDKFLKSIGMKGLSIQ